MPVRVLGPDGQTYSFPDGTDKGAAVRYFKNKGITGAPTSNSQPQGHPGAISRFASSAADASGLSTIGHALEHPFDTAGNVLDAMSPNPKPDNPIVQGVNGMIDNTEQNAKKGWVDYHKEGLTQNTRRDFGRAVPIVGPALAEAQTQHDAGNDAGMAGTIAGTVAGLAAPKALDEVLPEADTLRAKKDAFIQSKWPKNRALTPQEVASQKFVKALNPPIRGVERIKGATGEIPTVLEHAQRNNIPINGKLDFAKAAEGAAKEVQQHYDQNILRPHTSEQVAIPDSYGGERFSKDSNRATLGQINDRVNDINKELKSNFRKSLASETSQAQASDAALNAEKQQLTGILHQKLADATGLQPEDIAAVRQSAGKLRTLGEETKLSGNQDTLSLGREESGSSFSPSKHGLAEKGIKTVRGGQEIIGNRAINDALKGFEPKSPSLPQPVPPDPSIVPTTPEAAQQEFLRSAQGEQSAQDAAAARNAEAERLRAQNVGNQRDLAQKEVVRSAQGEQGAQDLAAARNKFANSRRAANTTAEQAVTDAQAATNKASAEAEVRKAMELQNAAQEAADSRAAVADDAREASKPVSLRNPATQVNQPTPTAAQVSTPIQLPQTTPTPLPTISDEEVVAADPSRGIQSVSLPVLHPAGEVTGFDESSGLPIVKRGAAAKTAPIELPAPAPTPESSTPTPETHSFSRQQWQTSNPDGDVEAAQKAAQEAGFEVQD